MEVNRSEKPIKIVLPSVLGLTETEDLLATVRELNAGGEPYVIDGSSVTRVGTPSLQILMAAIREKSGVHLTAPSLQFLAAIDDVGLTTFFEERIVLE